MNQYLRGFLDRLVYKCFNSVTAVVNILGDQYVTFNARPKSCKDFGRPRSGCSLGSETAVIIQGPVGNGRFLTESVRFYREKLFPNSVIIVSTWQIRDTELIDCLLGLGVKIVESNPPSNPGPGNINLQIITTSAGIREAINLGCNYAVKIRSDQRFYASGLLDYFFSLLSLFPPSSQSQRHRLICTSLDTFKYRLYGVSDFFMFGHIDDMAKFWSPPLDERSASFKYPHPCTVRDYSELRLCEVYLVTNYLISIKHTLLWSLQDSFNVFRKFFIVVDQEAVDLYWNKYNFVERKWHASYRDDFVFTERLTHSFWLQLYAQSVPIHITEELLDTLP